MAYILKYMDIFQFLPDVRSHPFVRRFDFYSSKKILEPDATKDKINSKNLGHTQCL